MRSFSRLSCVLLAGLALTASTACKDATTPDVTAPVARVTGVSVAPATATIRTGQTVALVADVAVEGEASRTVTWRSADASVATVSTAGVVTGVKAGTAVITAVATADTTKRASASVVVTAPTEAAISLQSVTQGGVPIPLTGASNQIDVSFNVDKGDRTLDKLELVLTANGKDTVVAQQVLTAAAVDGPEKTPVVIQMSFNSAAYNSASGTVAFKNGGYTLKGRLSVLGGAQLNSTPVALTLANADFLLGAVSTTPSAGQIASTTDAAGLVWRAGAVNVQVVPVVYSATPITAAVVTLPTGSVTISSLPGTATFANSTTAPGVGGQTFASLTPSVTTVTAGGQAGPAAFRNAAQLTIKLDNEAPSAPSYAFNTQGGTSNWVGAAYQFTTATGKGYTAGTDAGVGRVSTAFEVTTAPVATSSVFTAVTSAASLTESTLNTAYALRISEQDALGNKLATDIGGTFGVDKTAPTIAWGGGSVSADAIYTATSPVANFVVTATDGNSGLPASPYMVTVTRAANGVTGAATCPIGTYANGTCSPAARTASTAVDGGTAGEGYFTFNAYAVDRAGNASATSLTRRVLIDATNPTVGGISIPASLVGGSTVTFSSSIADNLDAVAAAFELAYPNATLRYDGPSFGSAFDGSQTTTSLVDFVVPSFIRSLEMVDGSNAVVDDRSNAKPTSITGVVYDAAGRSGSTTAAIPAPNVAGTYTYSSTPLATFRVINSATNISNPASGVTATNPTTVTLTARATAPTNSIPDPFTAVRFYYLNGTSWQLAGTATPAMTDDGVTRTFTYTLTWDPPANLGAGFAIDIRAVGVNATGDALSTRTNSNITLTNP